MQLTQRQQFIILAGMLAFMAILAIVAIWNFHQDAELIREANMNLSRYCHCINNFPSNLPSNFTH